MADAVTPPWSFVLLRDVNVSDHCRHSGGYVLEARPVVVYVDG